MEDESLMSSLVEEDVKRTTPKKQLAEPGELAKEFKVSCVT